MDAAHHNAVERRHAGDTKDMAPSTYAGPDAQKPAEVGAGVSARPQHNVKCVFCCVCPNRLLPVFQLASAITQGVGHQCIWA